VSEVKILPMKPYSQRKGEGNLLGREEEESHCGADSKCTEMSVNRTAKVKRREREGNKRTGKKRKIPTPINSKRTDGSKRRQ